MSNFPVDITLAAPEMQALVLNNVELLYNAVGYCENTTKQQIHVWDPKTSRVWAVRLPWYESSVLDDVPAHHALLSIQERPDEYLVWSGVGKAGDLYFIDGGQAVNVIGRMKRLK